MRLTVLAGLLFLVVPATVALVPGAPVPERADPAGRELPDSIPPVDEAGRDPELLTFRARLLRGLAEGDLDAVAAAADSAIGLSFGGDHGRETFRERLEEPEYRGELAEALGLGGVFWSDSTFVAPYVFARFPDGYDAFSCFAVLGRDVRAREAPDPDAPILGLLTYEPVCHPPSQWGSTDDWMPIRLDDGRTGWVAERFLRSPVDYRAILQKSNGAWRLLMFIAGD